MTTPSKPDLVALANRVALCKQRPTKLNSGFLYIGHTLHTGEVQGSIPCAPTI